MVLTRVNQIFFQCGPASQKELPTPAIGGQKNARRTLIAYFEL